MNFFGLLAVVLTSAFALKANQMALQAMRTAEQPPHTFLPALIMACMAVTMITAIGTLLKGVISR